jgi:NAD+--asparagine ADP-ribosyltransferase
VLDQVLLYSLEALNSVKHNLRLMLNQLTMVELSSKVISSSLSKVSNSNSKMVVVVHMRVELAQIHKAVLIAKAVLRNKLSSQPKSVATTRSNKVSHSKKIAMELDIVI